MATIDLTLNSFKVPDIDGYTPPFGTKITRTEANKGGLSTVEVNSNIMMPFANMRPKVVTEDSSTTAVEYDARLCFSASLASGATLTLGGGDYEGCRVQITNISAYTCTVNYGTSTIVSVPSGANIEVLWTGSTWMLSTTGTVAAGNVMPPTSEAVQAAIANENILSPYEVITVSTQSANPTIMDYDGFIYVNCSKGEGDAGGAFSIKINDTQFQYMLASNSVRSGHSDSFAVNKGDAVYYMDNRYVLSTVARFYKHRDYSRRT